MFRVFVSFLTLSLVALSAEATLQVSPSWIDFGQVEVGDLLGRTRSLQVGNRGPNAASISVSSIGCFEFSVQNTSCWAVLPPGGSCLMQVSFRPRTPGLKSCQLRLSDHTGSSISVNLSGSGVKR